MFKKIAADALGLSDIGQIISPENYNKVESDDYIMNEDGERIFFLIKSKADEYCFTNLALIHVDGKSALSKKRSLRRYDYYSHQIEHVSLETAGTIDLDVEIKFSIGGQSFSIDVDKKQLAQLKDLYKVLIRISQITTENSFYLQSATQSLNYAANTLGRVGGNIENLPEQFKRLNEYSFTWLIENKRKYNVKDFRIVFEKYIKN